MGAGVSAGENNDDLVDNLKEAEYIKSPLVERIFRTVDRGEYFLPDPHANPYRDVAWKNGNFHISAPCIYSEVMEGLKLEPGMSFLNLGSGTGYLSTMVGLALGHTGINHGIELHEDVVEYARRKVEEFKRFSGAVDEFDFCEPKFVQGNCLSLASDCHLYDRVYCGAGCPEQYLNYTKNLIKVGGILIVPQNDQLMEMRRTSETNWTVRALLPVSFATLVTLPPNCTDMIRLPEINPLSLQELCRAKIRLLLRKSIEADYPQLKPPIKPKRRKTLKKKKAAKKAARNGGEQTSSAGGDLGRPYRIPLLGRSGNNGNNGNSASGGGGNSASGPIGTHSDRGGRRRRRASGGGGGGSGGEEVGSSPTFTAQDFFSLIFNSVDHPRLGGGGGSVRIVGGRTVDGSDRRRERHGGRTSSSSTPSGATKDAAVPADAAATSSASAAVSNCGRCNNTDMLTTEGSTSAETASTVAAAADTTVDAKTDGQQQDCICDSCESGTSQPPQPQQQQQVKAVIEHHRSRRHGHRRHRRGASLSTSAEDEEEGATGDSSSSSESSADSSSAEEENGGGEDRGNGRSVDGDESEQFSRVHDAFWDILRALRRQPPPPSTPPQQDRPVVDEDEMPEAEAPTSQQQPPLPVAEEAQLPRDADGRVDWPERPENEASAKENTTNNSNEAGTSTIQQAETSSSAQNDDSGDNSAPEQMIVVSSCAAAEKIAEEDHIQQQEDQNVDTITELGCRSKNGDVSVNATPNVDKETEEKNAPTEEKPAKSNSNRQKLDSGLGEDELISVSPLNRQQRRRQMTTDDDSMDMLEVLTSSSWTTTETDSENSSASSSDDNTHKKVGEEKEGPSSSSSSKDHHHSHHHHNSGSGTANSSGNSRRLNKRTSKQKLGKLPGSKWRRIDLVNNLDSINNDEDSSDNNEDAMPIAAITYNGNPAAEEAPPEPPARRMYKSPYTVFMEDRIKELPLPHILKRYLVYYRELPS